MNEVGLAGRYVTRRAVVHVKVPLRLFGAYTLFGVAHDCYGAEPLRQEQVRIVERRARGGAKLVAAGRVQALVEMAGRNLARDGLALPVDPLATGKASS